MLGEQDVIVPKAEVGPVNEQTKGPMKYNLHRALGGVSRTGLEPVTKGLKGLCSTIELTAQRLRARL